MINALLRLDRTGAPWRDLPGRYGPWQGPWQSVATRFYRWTRSGLWQRILAELQAEADAGGGLDWEAHVVDSTVVRAHQHAAGAKGGSGLRRSGARAAASRPSSTCAATARVAR